MSARRLSLGLLLCLLAAACSPEDGRKRGERGADPGNRPDDGLLVRERTDVGQRVGSFWPKAAKASRSSAGMLRAEATCRIPGGSC